MKWVRSANTTLTEGHGTAFKKQSSSMTSWNSLSTSKLKTEETFFQRSALKLFLNFKVERKHSKSIFLHEYKNFGKVSQVIPHFWNEECKLLYFVFLWEPKSRKGPCFHRVQRAGGLQPGL